MPSEWDSNAPSRHATKMSIPNTKSSTFSSLLNRVRSRPPPIPWQTLEQPLPLIKFSAHSPPGSNSVRYVATGITPEAENLLSQLPVPLYIVAFAGFGRSGKSFTASKIRESLTGNSNVVFESAPGNIPCTHGIDMMVFEHPDEGHIVFLDCEVRFSLSSLIAGWRKSQSIRYPFCNGTRCASVF
jgi:hypothetical protein